MKIQMLPLMIKDAVKESNQIRIDKCNFILSDLFNIYNAIKEYNNSLLSPILKEYKNSFENMFFKLKSGVDFSKDEDYKIKDFILMPDRDLFKIRENKLQKVKKAANKFINNNRAGIGHVMTLVK